MKKVRYVRSDEDCDFNVSWGASARTLIEDAKESPEETQDYPIIYKLVPVSPASVERQAAKERAERKAKK